LALFCNIPFERVIEARDVATIYQAPLTYHEAGLDQQVLSFFHLQAPVPKMETWKQLTTTLLNPAHKVVIGCVGKYIHFPDTYKSLMESMIHAGALHNLQVSMCWIDAESLEDASAYDLEAQLKGVDTLIIPGGFGVRGVEGKIRAITYARVNQIPCLGICLGMQLMVVETARQLAGIGDANSAEFAPSAHPVVDVLSSWMKDGEKVHYANTKGMGGTMRLGAFPAHLSHTSRVFQIYGKDKISERHRHRYEVNMNYRPELEKAGLVFAGVSPDGLLTEIVERHDHPWFVGCQFHPEFKSRPFRPHPLLSALVGAAFEYATRKKGV
jgi:CTP synthase